VNFPVDTFAMMQALIRTPTVVLAGRELHELLPAVDVTVLAKVDSGPDAEAQARALRPDVVVLDLRVCESRCDATIRRIRETGCAVLVFNTSADENALVTAIRAGARGFVTGDMTAPELVHAIRVLAGGSALFGAGVAGSLLSRLSGRREDACPTNLTDREREVLDLVNAGHSHRAIAARLALAPKTIRNTVASINAKQRAADRNAPGAD
jgi:DNA-binding NarL/FixJ family response regulator